MFRSRLGKSTLAVGGLLFGLWVAENFVAERTGPTALLLYLPQQGWGLPPLVLLLWAGRQREWRLALLNGAWLLLWATALLGFEFALPSAAPNPPRTLRLMTYNIEYAAGGIAALEAAIRAQNPDIVCLQESQGRFGNHFFAAGTKLATRFPSWSAAQSGDVMTLSRFPIASQHSFPLRGTRRILETTYQTPGGQLQVLNLHVSTAFAGQTYAPPGKIGRLLQIWRQAQPAAQTRMQQIAPIQAATYSDPSLVPIATLLAGDFNSPPRGGFYGAISRGFTDAWQSGGRGTGATFPANFPLLPIDHVLASHISVRRAWVPAVRASDHRPLVVDFILSFPRFN